jgi:septum formation protein
MMSQRKFRILLASQSPRRQSLLREMGFEFSIVNAPIDEVFPSNLKAGDIPLYLAEQKALSLIPKLADNELLITADTIVWLNHKAVNKPSGKEDAIEMLTELSGNCHSVFTGVQISTKDQQLRFVDETKVYFSPLTHEQIEYYIDHFKPYDKAGAYGIQEWIGYVAIEKIEGSYFNVMGFPTHLVYKHLEQFLKI